MECFCKCASPLKIQRKNGFHHIGIFKKARWCLNLQFQPSNLLVLLTAKTFKCTVFAVNLIVNNVATVCHILKDFSVLFIKNLQNLTFNTNFPPVVTNCEKETFKIWFYNSDSNMYYQLVVICQHNSCFINSLLFHFQQWCETISEEAFLSLRICDSTRHFWFFCYIVLLNEI